ncbi:MAG: thioredoxin fold domain-containing protein [Helicobacter sp.]|nr:thioredoxin fold domain-containing protein [Helicobacter sp.]
MQLIKSIKFKLFFTMFAIAFIGCKSESVEINESNFSKGTDEPIEVIHASQNIDVKSYHGLEDVFQNSSEISTKNKYLFMVFGKNNCPYCEKLKRDLKSNTEARDYLKKNFSNYYINISYDKMHHVVFGEQNDLQSADISTRELSQNLYTIYGTPTLIFSDKTGKTIFEIPGYVPSDVFMKVLAFVNGGNWSAGETQKDRMKLLFEYIKN